MFRNDENRKCMCTNIPIYHTQYRRRHMNRRRRMKYNYTHVCHKIVPKVNTYKRKKLPNWMQCEPIEVWTYIDYLHLLFLLHCLQAHKTRHALSVLYVLDVEPFAIVQSYYLGDTNTKCQKCTKPS